VKTPPRLTYLGFCLHDANTTRFIVGFVLAVYGLGKNYDMYLFKMRGVVGDRSFVLFCFVF